MKKRYIVAATATLLATGGSLAGVAVGGGSDSGAPITFAPASGASQPVNPTSASAALSSLLSRVHLPHLQSASVSSPPSDRAATGQFPSSVWFYALVRVPSMSNGGDVEPMWEADLIQGAVAEAASTGTNLRDAVQGSSFDAVLPDGTVLKNADGGMGDIASGQHFATPSEERAREAILSAVGKAGLGLTSLQFFNVDGLEPQLTVVTHDPKATAQQLASLEKELFGSPPSYDGYYLAINMANGAPLARQSTSFRTGAGRFWIDPKYANSSTVATFGLYRPS